MVRDDVINKAKNFLADRLPWYKINNLIRTRQGSSCVYLPVEEVEEANIEMQAQIMAE